MRAMTDKSHLTISGDLTISIAASGGDPYRVVVHDGPHDTLVEMSAITRPHARQIAQSLALLLPKLRPGRGVVVECPRC